MRLHHVAIPVTDLARAERFYVDVLGLPIGWRFPDEDGETPRSIWLRLDDAGIVMLERVEAAPPKMHCLAMTIDASAREHWRAKLNQAGFPVESETPYTLYVRDPDGHRIALSHHPHEA